MTLLDSIGKKVKAMNYFVQELGLQHISAIQERAEVLGKQRDYAGKYDFVVSRATAYMSDILPWSLPFLKRNGKIILYKIYSEEEHKDGEQMARKLGLILEKVYEYELAGQKRCLYVFQRNILLRSHVYKYNTSEALIMRASQHNTNRNHQSKGV